MSAGARWRLFQVVGVESEYTIVDRETLGVRPVADELLRGMAGEYVNEIERDGFGWSNELVCHVIEIKTNGPAPGMRLKPADAHQYQPKPARNTVITR